jgi:hypothetical protein
MLPQNGASLKKKKEANIRNVVIEQTTLRKLLYLELTLMCQNKVFQCHRQNSTHATRKHEPVFGYDTGSIVGS